MSSEGGLEKTVNSGNGPNWKGIGWLSLSGLETAAFFGIGAHLFSIAKYLLTQEVSGDQFTIRTGMFVSESALLVALSVASHLHFHKGSDAFRKARPEEGTVGISDHYASASEASSAKSGFVHRAGTVIDYFTGYQFIGQIWGGVRRGFKSLSTLPQGVIKGASSAYSFSLTLLEAQLLLFGSPYAGEAVRIIETIARPGGRGLLYALDKSTRAD